MIHIIGDIIQSIGVIIAAIFIYNFPQYTIIDPLMTIFFCVIVTFTTIPIMRQCFRVIMDATPEEIDVEELESQINKVRILVKFTND